MNNMWDLRIGTWCAIGFGGCKVLLCIEEGVQQCQCIQFLDLCLLARFMLPVLPKLPSEVVSAICGIQGCSPYGRLLQNADSLHLHSVCFSFTDSVKGASGDHFCRSLCCGSCTCPVLWQDAVVGVVNSARTLKVRCGNIQTPSYVFCPVAFCIGGAQLEVV